jgi:uncharacterized protein (DUF58 family)
MGRWYLALTLMMGVVAITTGNNVLYLLESFLLGSIILSGVLSEKAVGAVEITWVRKLATAGEACSDIIEVINHGSLPIFCLEVGVWGKSGFQKHVLIPYLPGKETRRVESQYLYLKRGEHRWDGIACGTSYPFGFALKTRLIPQAGSRIIWPQRLLRHGLRNTRESASTYSSQVLNPAAKAVRSRNERSGDFLDGEVRPLQQGDDYREVVWTLSLARGEPLVRQRGTSQENREAFLDLKVAVDSEFEKKVSEIAAQVLEGLVSTLIVLESGGSRVFQGKIQILNTLALLPLEGKAEGENAA